MKNKQQGTILVVDDSVLMCDLIDKALTKIILRLKSI